MCLLATTCCRLCTLDSPGREHNLPLTTRGKHNHSFLRWPSLEDKTFSHSQKGKFYSCSEEARVKLCHRWQIASCSYTCENLSIFSCDNRKGYVCSSAGQGGCTVYMSEICPLFVIYCRKINYMSLHSKARAAFSVLVSGQCQNEIRSLQLLIKT